MIAETCQAGAHTVFGAFVAVLNRNTKSEINLE